MARSELAPLVVLGGPRAMRRLARGYALQRGWRSWIEIEPPGKRFGPQAKHWADGLVAACLVNCPRGGKVLVLAPMPADATWVRQLRRQGRRVKLPLAGLSLGAGLLRLAQWNSVKVEQQTEAWWQHGWRWLQRAILGRRV